MAARLAYERNVKESKGRPPVVLYAHTVLTLARSPKFREADDLAETV